MDLGTIVGFVMIFGFLGSAMAIGVGIGPYMDLPSALIVIGGSLGSLLIGFKLEQMKNEMENNIRGEMREIKERLDTLTASLEEYKDEGQLV